MLVVLGATEAFVDGGTVSVFFTVEDGLEDSTGADLSVADFVVSVGLGAVVSDLVSGALEAGAVGAMSFCVSVEVDAVLDAVGGTVSSAKATPPPQPTRVAAAMAASGALMRRVNCDVMATVHSLR